MSAVKLSEFLLEIISQTELLDLASGMVICKTENNAPNRIARCIYNNYHLADAKNAPDEPLERVTDRDFSPLLGKTIEETGWIACRLHDGCATKSGVHVLTESPSQNITLIRHFLHLNASWGWHSFRPSTNPIQPSARLYVSGKCEPASTAEVAYCLSYHIGDRWRLKFSYLSMTNRPDTVTIYLENSDLSTLVSESPDPLHFLGKSPGFATVTNGIAHAIMPSPRMKESFGWIKAQKAAEELLAKWSGVSYG